MMRTLSICSYGTENKYKEIDLKQTLTIGFTLLALSLIGCEDLKGFNEGDTKTVEISGNDTLKLSRTSTDGSVLFLDLTISGNVTDSLIVSLFWSSPNDSSYASYSDTVSETFEIPHNVDWYSDSLVITTQELDSEKNTSGSMTVKYEFIGM